MLCDRVSRESWNIEEQVLPDVGLGSVARAKPDKILSEKRMEKLFLIGQVVVSQMGEAREE